MRVPSHKESRLTWADKFLKPNLTGAFSKLNLYFVIQFITFNSKVYKLHLEIIFRLYLIKKILYCLFHRCISTVKEKTEHIFRFNFEYIIYRIILFFPHFGVTQADDHLTSHLWGLIKQGSADWLICYLIMCCATKFQCCAISNNLSLNKL